MKIIQTIKLSLIGVASFISLSFSQPKPQEVMKKAATLNMEVVSYKQAKNAKLYTFTFEELYPLEEDRKLVNKQRSKVIGTIEDVNFIGGIMQIASTDGETLTVQFYPLEVSSATHNKLRLALKPGNKIKSVCALAGSSTLDLVSATISTP